MCKSYTVQTERTENRIYELQLIAGRWHNQLNPELRHTPFTADEDRLIIEVKLNLELKYYMSTYTRLSPWVEVVQTIIKQEG